MKRAVKNQTCTQCGTCCQKNGPALHREDWPLVEKGIIPLSHLYTLRAGELARDNVRDILAPLPTDVIKIKGKKGAPTCLYLNDEQKTCGIYDHRPAECRALKCWDTRALEALYAKNRLDRKTVLRDKPEFWALVQDHQQRCDYDQLERLIGRLDAPQGESALKTLSEIIHYDRSIRTLMVEKAKLDPEICDFLFGRPLTITLRGYGIRFKESEGGKLIITPDVKI